jgi:urease accessory protein
MECSAASVSDWLPALLQTADPLFPTGAYAHSFGFEETVRMAELTDEKDLTFFLQHHVIPQLERAELPYLRFAINAADSLEELCAIDREIDAWKLASESRLASRQIGKRRLSALHKTYLGARLQAYVRAVEGGATPGHHLCSCAIQSAVQGTPLNAALIVYGYQSLAGVCTAALKLIRIGQDACQRALTAALHNLPDTMERSLLIEREDAGCFAPILEIAAMRHAFANERLFIS